MTHMFRFPHLLLAPLFVLYSTLLFAQSHVDWNTLADVKFEQVYSEEFGITYDSAAFGPFILLFEKKEVKITGYMIPLDGMGISYVISRNPMATCFFCGGAGAETVIELELAPSAYGKYHLDDYRTFKGILRLNKINMDHLTYVLKGAEPMD